MKSKYERAQALVSASRDYAVHYPLKPSQADVNAWNKAARGLPQWARNAIIELAFDANAVKQK